MEWTRIEAKWHAMALRLQQGCASGADRTGLAADAVSRPDRKTGPEMVLRRADDRIVRAAEV